MSLLRCTRMLCFGQFLWRELFSEQCLVKAWNPVCSVKRDSHKNEDGQARCPTHQSWASLSMATSERWRRQEKTTGLCDPCGELRLRVRDSTRPALKHSTVTSRPCRQISVQLPWHLSSPHRRTGQLFLGQISVWIKHSSVHTLCRFRAMSCPQTEICSSKAISTNASSGRSKRSHKRAVSLLPI